MSRSAIARKTIVATCCALNPDPDKRGPCGTVLGDIPARVRLVALVVKRPEHVNGRIRLQCPRRDCRTWNVFEAVSE